MEKQVIFLLRRECQSEHMLHRAHAQVDNTLESPQEHQVNAR